MYFPYGQTEMNELKKKDKRLGEVVDRLGKIEREVDPDLFSSLVHQIVGQQITTKAQETIWQRMRMQLGTIDARTVLQAGADQLQAMGISHRKADYITELSEKVDNGTLKLEALWQLPDEEVVQRLSCLRGVGVWTAEMLLLFCMQRPNVLSYHDKGIRRGMRMVYHHWDMDKELFETYRRSLSPLGSVASFYFWAVAGGAIPELKDDAP